MKYLLYILTLTMGFITSLFSWIYIQRTNLAYNSEGKFFSSEDGVIYQEQAKEIFGTLTILGFILTGLLIIRLITKNQTT